MRLQKHTGACGYNRPCAHQYVGKSQSCMVESGRLIPHASYDCTSSVSPPFTDESSPFSLKPYKASSLARRAASRFLSSSTALFIDSEAVALGTAREPVNAAFCDHYAHTNANTRARVRMIGREIFRRAWARARGAAGDFQHKKPRHSPKQVTETDCAFHMQWYKWRAPQRQHGAPRACAA